MRALKTACLVAIAVHLSLSSQPDARAQKARVARARAGATSAGVVAGGSVVRTAVRGLQGIGKWLARRGSKRVSVSGSYVALKNRNGEAIMATRATSGSATLRFGRDGSRKPSRKLELSTQQRGDATSFSLRRERPVGDHVDLAEMTLGAGPVAGRKVNSAVFMRFRDGKETSRARYVDGEKRP